MFPFGFLASVASVVRLTEDRREGFGETCAQLFVVGDVQARVERLVRQPPVGVARVLVGAVSVGEEPQRVVEECASASVVLAVLGEATVHVRQARADAVLMPLQGVEVDGVGEVRGEELVGLCFQACAVRGQVSNFLILARVALIECRIHIGSEALIGRVADRDGGVGVRDEAFRDGDRHGPSRAVRLLGGTAGAHEVGVGRAAWIGGEVEQHA